MRPSASRIGSTPRALDHVVAVVGPSRHDGLVDGRPLVERGAGGPRAIGALDVRGHPHPAAGEQLEDRAGGAGGLPHRVHEPGVAGEGGVVEQQAWDRERPHGLGRLLVESQTLGPGRLARRPGLQGHAGEGEVGLDLVLHRRLGEVAELDELIGDRPRLLRAALEDHRPGAIAGHQAGADEGGRGDGDRQERDPKTERVTENRHGEPPVAGADRRGNGIGPWRGRLRPGLGRGRTGRRRTPDLPPVPRDSPLRGP